MPSSGEAEGPLGSALLCSISKRAFSWGDARLDGCGKLMGFGCSIDIFDTKPSFTREDLKLTRKTLEEAGINRTACQTLLSLISMVRTELRDAGVRAREECFNDCMANAIRIVEAARPANVRVDVDASSPSASEAVSESEAVGKKKMGDKISIGGDAINSAVGSGALFKARDVTSYKQGLQGAAIDDDIKAVLAKKGSRGARHCGLAARR